MEPMTNYPHAARVLDWLGLVFAQRLEWLPAELELEARKACIDWPLWHNAPPVLAAGLRMVERELWPGYRAKVYVMGERSDG